MKKVRIIIIIVFIGFFVLISGASLIIKDREFSPNENRYLAETPELSWDNILSGKFQDGLEDYLRDQVCFRDGWITVKTGIQKACGDTDIGGAYVGKDGYDFEKITPEDFVDEPYHRLAEQLFEQYETTGAVNPALLINQYEDMEEQMRVASVLQTTLQIEPSPEDNSLIITEIVQKVKEESIKNQLAHLQDYSKLQDLISQRGQIPNWNISLECG